MTLTGEVVQYVDPPPRSKWAEPAPEVLDQGDDLDAVAEAAAEVIASDLDAELADLTPDADQHLFARNLTRGVMRAVSDETPTVRLMLTGHLLAMGPADSHKWPIEAVGALAGATRSAASKASARLVELDLLERIEQGRVSAAISRPAMYRATPHLLSLAEQTCVSDEHTGDQHPEQTSTCVSNEHTGACVSDEHTVEISRELTTTTSRGSGADQESTPDPLVSLRSARPDYIAPDATCQQCGGAVTRAPDGSANDLCKTCHLERRPTCCDCDQPVTIWQGTPNLRCKTCHLAAQSAITQREAEAATLTPQRLSGAPAHREDEAGFFPQQRPLRPGMSACISTEDDPAELTERRSASRARLSDIRNAVKAL